VSSSDLEAAGVPLQRAWCDGGCVANTQAALLLRLLLIVLLGQLAELGGVFLLDCASFAVELLDVVEPSDATRDLEPPQLAPEQVVLSATLAELVRIVHVAESAGEGTYPGVYGLEAILRDIRISSCSRVRCGRVWLPSIPRRTGAQCRPPCFREAYRPRTSMRGSAPQT
jgi:hypothetical protein